jgi:O-antigen ligase
MVGGPFLLPFHTWPVPSFWTEWWVCTLGLAASLTGLSVTRDRLHLSQLLLIPAVLLATLVLQFALARVGTAQLGLFYGTYLLWAALLMVLGRHLADTVGLRRLADVLAVAFVLGTLAGSAVALLQWLGVADRVPWAYLPESRGIQANLGQENHHAHYSWLGIASAFYLRGRAYLSRGWFWLLVLSVTFGSVLSGSRSVVLYALLILFLLAFARHRDSRVLDTDLLADAAILLPVLVALNLFGAWMSPRIPEFWVWLGGLHPWLDIGVLSSRAGDALMPGARLYESISGPSVRMSILRTAWAVFGESPWLGQGAGNYAWGSLLAATGQSVDRPMIVSEHAHNVVFQLLAEFGAPATLLVIALLVVWARQFLRRPWTLEHTWCASILGIGAVHSLLEYPYWYSYFLAPTALLLGATDRTKNITLAGRRIAVYLFLLALAGAVILGKLSTDHAKLEQTIYQPLAGHPDREIAWRISMASLLQLHDESMLSPWALMAFTQLAEPSRQQAGDRARLCERGIRFSPTRWLATSCAMQLALAGTEGEARRLIADVLRAYPKERAATYDQLRAGAERFPELEALRAFASEGSNAPRQPG